MNTLDAIKTMRAETNKSKGRPSIALGRSNNYVSTMLQTQNDTNVSTFCAIAQAMGYEMAARKDGQEIILGQKID